ncbi:MULTISPECIES: hypothetical protein [Burkholderia]|uniref:hypothetical protein n=1 Tax=Burkholderia TaxID=32008 RepID=UPI0015891431|nr:MULTISPECIES: hypothetical protein [Burkholderia]
MKRQCGHIRKNDAFAFGDPEENAGKRAEAARLAGRRGEGFADFSIVDEKAPDGKRRGVNNSG